MLTFQIRPSSNSAQPFYWRMVAGNGHVLAHSETYATKQACKDAITVVKRQAGSGVVQDDT